MADTKLTDMLGRIDDPARRWFKHIETRKIRDALGENVGGYESMSSRKNVKPAHSRDRAPDKSTWEEITAAEAKVALVDLITADAKALVERLNKPTAPPPPAVQVEAL